LSVRYAHVVEAVGIFDVLVVEPWTVASLPRCGAYHAKLGSASTIYHVSTCIMGLA
jgi:hypothetical protein